MYQKVNIESLQHFKVVIDKVLSFLITWHILTPTVGFSSNFGSDAVFIGANLDFPIMKLRLDDPSQNWSILQH